MKYASLVLKLTVAIVLLPTLVYADDGAFCDNSTFELLSAIEGEWTFKQEPGYGIGGPIPFPLPAQPAQSVRIELNADEGAAYLRHAGQEMAMIPVDAGFARELDFYLSPEEETNILGESSGCDWQTIPLIVGANVYSLTKKDGPPRDFFLMQLGGGQLARCAGRGTRLDEATDETFKFVYISEDGTMFRSGAPKDMSAEPSSRLDAEYLEKTCLYRRPGQEPKVVPGQMVMALIVKFNSANSGAGVLQFNGKQGSVNFAARAPVFLSR